MLTGVALASSHLLASGERWSITGAIVCTLACLWLRFGLRPEKEGTNLGRWKGVQLVAVLSPLLILAGGVMMLAAVV
jgi:hypothetical protein